MLMLHAKGSPTRAEIDAFCVSVYNNLAASYLARASSGRPPPGGTIDGDYKSCVQASTFGIELTPTCKALYRRARALSEPMTASDVEVDAAIRDLNEAAKVEPEDKAVRALLHRLKKERADAKAKDKGALSGIFGKVAKIAPRCFKSRHIYSIRSNYSIRPNDPIEPNYSIRPKHSMRPH